MHPAMPVRCGLRGSRTCHYASGLIFVADDDPRLQQRHDRRVIGTTVVVSTQAGQACGVVQQVSSGSCSPYVIWMTTKTGVTFTTCTAPPAAQAGADTSHWLRKLCCPPLQGADFKARIAGCACSRTNSVSRRHGQHVARFQPWV
jgi:hypothetical protein